MADQTQAQQDVVEEQQSPMPSEEQNLTETPQGEEAGPEVEVSESPDTEEELSLSDGVSSRTAEQFDKLREQLGDERMARQRLESTFNSLSQRPKESTPLYNPDTGYVDVNQLEQMQKATTEANKKATLAEQRFEKYVQQQQEREAYEAFPELDPNAKNHDKELHKMTRAIITDSLMNPDDYGGELPAKQAAELARSQQSKTVEKAKKQAATDAVEQLGPKEQASLEVTGRSDRRDDVANQSDLIERTRRGDAAAIMERFSRIAPVSES